MASTNLPLYCLSAEICFETCCTCKSNLTRSIGATTVLETAAEIPPARKSLRNEYGSALAIMNLCTPQAVAEKEREESAKLTTGDLKGTRVV